MDKRLAGIQAVQTLSRLNRCHPGKGQTYGVDFVNDPADILAAFKPYFETAELSRVTDPYIVNELKGKRAKPSELDAATTPVASRLLTAYTIRDAGDPELILGVGEPEKIYVIDESGSGEVQDKTRFALSELIAKANGVGRLWEDLRHKRSNLPAPSA